MFRIVLIAEMVCCLPLGLKNVGTVFETGDSAIREV
jgi:hypothetical protein